MSLALVSHVGRIHTFALVAHANELQRKWSNRSQTVTEQAHVLASAHVK
ncbi:hypothetical protein PC129_g6872 [Phytophthora cactorum]|uniref:Uncharacterized protein n=1 Tax=Phytophthora cactorum TaxID=29920 RepID=A0A8T1IE78_9STRA|nr:hypothetical protein PC120_g16314 [Phytophthora cactorum]KAG3084022.1 hypothetical protein PC121_g5518 [Phytophthora cactorum]KAG3222426.1 hypothetical protein PC129_g6872 [Phytophthora cactorum]KAG4060917.1 hypothetical protein PC123_g4197 [Phytophthora cactorum]